MGTSNERFRATRNISSLEATRNKLQRELDSKKTLEERRLFGQFSTPNDLAREIIGYGLQLVEDKDISFLEPAIGTGSFYSALLAETSVSRNISATGYEIDEQIFFAAQQLWKDENLVLFNEDFTQSTPTETVNLLVCNPPYVRHHLLKSDEKRRLCTTVKDETNITLSGLAGLYCHFLLLAHKWLKPDAICGWLIPSEFMDVNYGIALKEYLLKHVHLLRVHRYNPSECKFDDALVSSAVVWFKNEMIDGDYEVEFSFGGTHHRPLVQKQIKKSTLIKESKWTRFPTQEIRNPQNDSQYYLNNFFDIKRGIATGDNGFFILNKEQIENFNLDMDYFTPILPSPRNLKTDRIEADKNGFPILSTPLFLLDSRLGEDEIQIEHPTLWAYLQSGLSTTANKHLCKNRARCKGACRNHFDRAWHSCV